MGLLYWKAKLKPQSELEQASVAEFAPLELASQILSFFLFFYSFFRLARFLLLFFLFFPFFQFFFH